MSVSMRYGSRGAAAGGEGPRPSYIITETGSFSIPAQTAAGTTDVTISYDVAHASAPYLVVVGTNNSASVFAVPGVSGASTTGATVRMRNLQAHTLVANFQWFALEAL